MANAFAKTLQKNSFWLALLIHLLIFFLVSWALLSENIKEESRALTIPSYVYHEEQSHSTQYEEKSKSVNKKQVPFSQNGILKPATESTHELSQPLSQSVSESSEPVHLVGEKGVPKPLIILLGKALTAHLLYPKIATDFNLHGVAVVGFVVHPDGQVTDVRLVKSSRTEVLDQEAVLAASQMSPVKNVNLYLKEPKYIVFGIIFGSR
jgi:TonB family protein